MSVHEILEFDELRLLHELGHEVYSLGAYTHPYGDEGRKRPGLPQLPYDPHFIELATRYSKDDLHPEMIEPADVVIVMHEPSFILKNWGKLRHKRVIWRTIGQSVEGVERALAPLRQDGLQIVRYSPQEASIPGYIGADAMIRFYKDPEEYCGWVGDIPRAVNFTQSMASRGTHCNYDLFAQVAAGVPTTLYGPGNDSFAVASAEGLSMSGGLLSCEGQREALRRHGAYFYTGTHPASYTLGFIEAWMTGIPVVAVGPHWGSPYRSGYAQATYEIPDLFDASDGGGTYSDNVDVLASTLTELLFNPQAAKEMGEEGRARAIELFGKETIKNQWREFLG